MHRVDASVGEALLIFKRKVIKVLNIMETSNNSKPASAELVKQMWMEIESKGNRPSLEKVALELYNRGYYNVGKRKPFSRQWIKIRLSEDPAMRAKLQAKYTRENRSVIISDNAGLISWLKNKGMVDVPVVPPSQATVSLVKRAWVYGDVPLSLVLHARSVFLVCVDKEPVTRPVSEKWLNDNNAKLREYKLYRVQ